MSVDYYSCDSCGESRYEEAVAHCNSCGRDICDECVVHDNEKDNDYEGYFPSYMMDEIGLKKEYCPFCSGITIDETELLDYIIKKYNLNETELREEFLKSNINK